MAALLLVLPGSLTGQDQQPALTADAGMVEVGGFAIDVYEFPNRLGAQPRVNVTWAEAAAACAAQGKRLCTDREWREACAGPTGLLYGYGPVFAAGRCNTPFPVDGVWQRGQGTAAAGAFAACTTPAGAHDMIGNVWEWTADAYASGTDWHTVRGGSWFHNANMATAEFRYGRYLTEEYRSDLVGFRCCRPLP